MSLDYAKAAYRRARISYALQELRNEMRLYANDIERRLRRARTDEELRELLSAIVVLREARRFYRETIAPKAPRFDFAAALNIGV
ncbi:MAG: hypothetical protein LBF86_09730 [Helicobacteraceae bacterium]|jgi:predicted metal-dependent hydrolase|nr:hypothetical protein [Helicobacteraceae bacterium]